MRDEDKNEKMMGSIGLGWINKYIIYKV